MDRQAAAIAAAKYLSELPIFKSSQHIACYSATDDEFDTMPIIETIWQANKICYLPVLCHEKEKYLQFVKYQYGDSLQRNKYKILEPSHLSQKIAANELDLVIMPLLAFDLHGHRLGTGGGYYDRTFEFLHEAAVDAARLDTKAQKAAVDAVRIKSKVQKPFMLGLGYALQQAETLPTEEWDVHLDAVLTEKGETK